MVFVEVIERQEHRFTQGWRTPGLVSTLLSDICTSWNRTGWK